MVNNPGSIRLFNTDFCKKLPTRDAKIINNYDWLANLNYISFFIYMPRTLSGLNSGEFDTIDIFHSLTVGGNPGQPGTVLTSDGSNINWSAVNIEAGSIGTAQLAADAVTSAQLADDSVDSVHIVNV